MAAVLLLALGTAIRLWIYFSALPLRIDEVRLAMNLLERSYADLFEPLRHGQAAPLGFLLAGKLIADLGGDNELAYRLLPVLSGILGLWVFWRIARRYLLPAGAVISLAAISMSPTLTTRAVDFKQYSSDFLLTAAMLAVALPWLAGSRSAGRWLAIVLMGSLCLSFSHPGVFYVAAAGLVWLFQTISARNKEDVARLLVASAIWLLVLAVVYEFNMRYSEGKPGLQYYWQRDFMPTDSPWSSLRWMAASMLKVPHTLGFNLGRTAYIWLFLLAAIGQVSLVIKERSTGSAMFLMILLPFLAAVLHQYPFGDRAIIFLLPVFLFMMAEGFNRILMAPNAARVVLVLVCFSYMLPFTIREFERPNYQGGRYDVVSVLKYLRDHAPSDDEEVLVVDTLSYPYLYYERRLVTDRKATILNFPRGEIASEAARSVLRSALQNRQNSRTVWLVVPDRRYVERNSYQKLPPVILSALGGMGTIEESVEFPNVVVYRVNVSPGEG
jgi:hypothetical protein